MAVAARDIPITREEVDGWLVQYNGIEQDQPALKDFLAAKIEELKLEDEFVDVAGRDDFAGNSIYIVDYLMEDIHTYSEYRADG